jgi:hypothetical protein
MNDKIRSRELYDVVVGDADGGDDGTRSMLKSQLTTNTPGRSTA